MERSLRFLDSSALRPDAFFDIIEANGTTKCRRHTRFIQRQMIQICMRHRCCRSSGKISGRGNEERDFNHSIGSHCVEVAGQLHLSYDDVRQTTQAVSNTRKSFWLETHHIRSTCSYSCTTGTGCWSFRFKQPLEGLGARIGRPLVKGTNLYSHDWVVVNATK